MTHAEDAPAARRSTRGQSIVEFALIVLLLLVMFIAIADFGRIFAAIIALEASTRNVCGGDGQQLSRDAARSHAIARSRR